MILFKKFKATWNDVGMDGYNLYLSRDGGSFDKYNDSLITETEIIIEDIEFDPHEVKVTGVLGGVESELSDPVSFTSIPTFETDFSEYELGNPPPDWNKARWHEISWVIDDAQTNPVSGVDKILYRRILSSNRYLISWDVLDGISDAEILSLSLTPEFNVTNALRMYMRASGDSTTESGYFTECDFDTDVYRIRKYDATGSTVDLGSAAKSLVSNNWYWQKIRIEGTSIKAKIWEHGTSEPFAWDIEVTDSEFSSGWFGVGFFSQEYFYGAYYKADVLTKPTT